MNTVFTWQSGLPFTPSYRDCNADRDTGWCRPDLVGEWKPEQADRRRLVHHDAARSRRARHAAHHERPDARPLGPAASAARSALSVATGCLVPRSRSGICRSSRISSSTEAFSAQFRAEVVQLPEHGQSREPESVRGLPGHRRTDYEHLPAGHDASVAVWRADGILISYQCAAAQLFNVQGP